MLQGMQSCLLFSRLSKQQGEGNCICLATLQIHQARVLVTKLKTSNQVEGKSKGE
ncbi:hypothetical protein ACE6H2_011525 [Prunus campanulata]